MTVAAAVVFDVGGVLLDWNPRHLYRRLLADEAAVDAFLSDVCTLEWHFRHDAGRPFAESIPELCQTYPEQAELIQAWSDRYLDMIGGPLDGTVAVLEELDDAGIPTYGLTNMPAEVWAPMVEAHPFLARIRGWVVSGQERVVKPDPAIFALLVDRFGLDPATTAFVDDTTVNTDAATHAGLVGIPFGDADTLRCDLRDLGLPV